MAALLGAAPSAADVARAIAGQLAVIAPVEAVAKRLSGASRAVFEGYRPRAPLAQADLAIIGAELPPLAVLEEPRFNSPEEWLGFRYVIEGSSLGGALILRRLAASGCVIPGLRFFDAHGERRGVEWQNFCAMLDAALGNDRSRDAAAHAAGETFDAIRRAMEEIGT